MTREHPSSAPQCTLRKTSEAMIQFKGRAYPFFQQRVLCLVEMDIPCTSSLIVIALSGTIKTFPPIDSKCLTRTAVRDIITTITLSVTCYHPFFMSWLSLLSVLQISAMPAVYLKNINVMLHFHRAIKGQ